MDGEQRFQSKEPKYFLYGALVGQWRYTEPQSKESIIRDGKRIPSPVYMARKAFRTKKNIEQYSGVSHLTLTTGISITVVSLCVWMLNQVTPFEWLTIPLVLLYANLSEYLGHKGPMHKETRFLSLIYQRHTLEHHYFFTHEAMAIESTKDYKAVLFPLEMIAFFFGCFALPVALLIYFLLSPNVAFLFVITSTLYFLNYEILHLVYHLKSDSWAGKLPIIEFLSHHHTLHHDPRLMNRYNFNVTFPLFDFLFGTYRKS